MPTNEMLYREIVLQVSIKNSAMADGLYGGESESTVTLSSKATPTPKAGSSESPSSTPKMTQPLL